MGSVLDRAEDLWYRKTSSSGKAYDSEALLETRQDTGVSDGRSRTNIYDSPSLILQECSEVPKDE